MKIYELYNLELHGGSDVNAGTKLRWTYKLELRPSGTYTIQIQKHRDEAFTVSLRPGEGEPNSIEGEYSTLHCALFAAVDYAISAA